MLDILLFKDSYARLESFLAWLLVVLAILAAYSMWYEVTFDYSACEQTDTFEPRHRAAWIQNMPMSCSNNVCTGGGTIIHPARHWHERLYICPTDEYGITFEKWREEAKP